MCSGFFSTYFVYKECGVILRALPKTKKRDNSIESPRLVLLLNGFQAVRMTKLLRFF